MAEKKYCKHCGEQIDADCVVCPKCGKQVEQLKNDQQSVIINNNASASSSAAASAAASGPTYVIQGKRKNKWVAFFLCLSRYAVINSMKESSEWAFCTSARLAFVE